MSLRDALDELEISDDLRSSAHARGQNLDALMSIARLRLEELRTTVEQIIALVPSGANRAALSDALQELT
jgi:hypothetical protein